MAFFDDKHEPEPTDMASRIGSVIGHILSGFAYLLIIFPVAYSFFR